MDSKTLPTLAELRERGVRLHGFEDVAVSDGFRLAAVTCGDMDGDGNVRVYAVLEPAEFALDKIRYERTRYLRAVLTKPRIAMLRRLAQDRAIELAPAKHQDRWTRTARWLAGYGYVTLLAREESIVITPEGLAALADLDGRP